MTEKDILREYNIRKSIKATAKSLEISEGVVRKVLITYRVLKSPLIDRIAELRAVGMPEKDIADLLNVSSACVSSNSAYERGTYLNPSKTSNAERIRKCRARKKEAEG